MTELKVLTAEQQVANILAADARRVRRLTWATIGLWVPPLLVMLGVAVCFGGIHSRADSIYRRYSLMRERMPPQTDPTYPERYAVAESVMLMEGVTRVLIWVTGAVVLFSLSALGTVLLVHASRRATLRQIQASLAAIAGQLAEVQRGRGTMPPTAGG